MTVEEIREKLFSLRDEGYADFQARLIPGAPRKRFIGVRTPELRRFARELVNAEGTDLFLDDLPHGYFDEDQLHAFIISGMKDYDGCMERLERFLPFIDNWATCDQLSPKVFKKHKEELIIAVYRWLESDAVYTVRFALGMLMEHFLGDDFREEYLETAASVRSDEYYVKMMVAWYFATALAKQYAAALPYIGNRRLDKWTHNKTIQKAVESYRITGEQKDYLRTLKIKG